MNTARLGADWLFNRILGYRTLPKTQLQLPILGVEYHNTQLGDRHFLVLLRERLDRPTTPSRVKEHVIPAGHP